MKKQYLPIVLLQIPLFAVVAFQIWNIPSSIAHRKRMEASQQKRAAAAEQELVEQREWRAKRDKEEAERAEQQATNVAARAAEVDDKSAYAVAYRLLHPRQTTQEDSKVAIRLLRRYRELSDIPPRELDLLYTAYNNLHSPGNGAFEVAEALWQTAPGTYRALRTITNAMHNKYMLSGDVSPIIEFVDTELGRHNGGEHELLILKAKALVHRDDSLPDKEKKKLVADVLIKAVAFAPCRDPAHPDWWTQSASGLLDYEDPFPKFFSTAEREALQPRLNAAMVEPDRLLPVAGQ